MLERIARVCVNFSLNSLDRLRRPFGYTRRERENFREVLQVWRPREGTPAVMLRWLITEWCNFKCSYCFQASHDRFTRKKRGLTAHAFDNFSVELWLSALERHFSEKRLSLTITGGEPMLDVRNMRILLDRLGASPWCVAIRIDTNASWGPEAYSGMNKAKLILNCSYHPSMVNEERYIAKLRAIKEAGFNVGMVNYVLSGEQKHDFFRIREKLGTLGIPVNANPEFQERYSYDEEFLKELRECILEQDFYFKIGRSPRGKTCLYPSVGYEMSQTGCLSVGCIGSRRGSLFDPVLPSIGDRSIACPHNECSCIDKYSFLLQINRNLSTNVLQTYCDLLRKKTLVTLANSSKPDES
jgi:organic radical activating enzyme